MERSKVEASRWRQVDVSAATVKESLMMIRPAAMIVIMSYQTCAGR